MIHKILLLPLVFHYVCHQNLLKCTCTILHLSDDIFRHTYVEREAGETSNDRNDRAIREAVKWYNKHLQTSRQIQTLLLTNDADNRKKALDQGIQSYTS